MFLSFHILIFWFLVFWSLWLHDFLFIIFCLAHLALQNVNKDCVIFLYFHNFVHKSDQKTITKNWMNRTIDSCFCKQREFLNNSSAFWSIDKILTGKVENYKIRCSCNFVLNSSTSLFGILSEKRMAVEILKNSGGF